MLIRNVQVAHKFFTILLSLYNSTLLSEPVTQIVNALASMSSGLLTQLTTLRKQYMNMDPCLAFYNNQFTPVIPRLILLCHI